MANIKGAKKTEGSGRKLGTLNKFTHFKDALIKAYGTIGGDVAFAKWAKNPHNKTDFYKIMAKLLPRNVSVDAAEGAQFKITVESKKK